MIEVTNPPVVELDSEAHAAYVRFSRKKVVTTKSLTMEECIITLDLDADQNPVGVELIGVDEFGIFPLLKMAGLKLPDGMADRARYVPANLQPA